MESDDGGFGGFSFDSTPAGDGSRLLLLTVAPKRMGMTNRSFRDSFVISFSFRGLVVKGGCTVSWFNISSLSQKKKHSGRISFGAEAGERG